MPKTLTHILSEKKHLTETGITFIEGSDIEFFQSYRELYHSSVKVLSFLQAQGIKPLDELVLQIDNNKNFIVIFWACLLGGIIPVPVTVGQTDDHKQKLFNIWRVLNNPYLAISQSNANVLHDFVNQTCDVG